MKLLILLLGLFIVLQLLHVRLVGNARRTWDTQTLLDCWSSVDAFPPLVDVWKLLQVDTSEVRDVDPAEVGNVCDTVLVADEVFLALKSLVEDAVEALGLSNIPLCWVRDSLLCETEEVVCLALSTC